MSGPVLVELKGADISREGSHEVVIRDVNWRLEAGDFWAIAGDPGSGKSSLLETAAGLTVPVSGRVEILGHDIAAANEEEHLNWRRQIGFVFENGGRLLSQLSVADNIALPLLYHDEADEEEAQRRVAELLDEAGLLGIEQMLPSRLSLATQQRVGYLRAVVQPKRVVFIDHPVGRRWWPRMLTQLRSRQATAEAPVTVALTCADFRPWIDVATHFAIIREGTFRQIGDREQLLASSDKLVTQFR